MGIHADTLTEEQKQIIKAMKKQDLVELYNKESKRLSPNKVIYHQVSYSVPKYQIVYLFGYLLRRYA